jgi:hypothetical protein
MRCAPKDCQGVISIRLLLAQDQVHRCLSPAWPIPARTTVRRTIKGVRAPGGILDIAFRDPFFIINGINLIS